MNPTQAISPDDQKVVEFSENPGRRLRVQRQSRGIEVERIAAQLHLRVAAVEALEQDRYQDLPGPVFVTGYLRNYARLVGLDPEPLIATYRAANPAAEPTGLRVSPLPRQEIGSGHILVRLISLALLAAVIAMLVLWWQSRSDLLSSAPPGEASGLARTAPAGQLPLNRPPGPAAPEAVATSPTLPLPTATASRPEPGSDNATPVSRTPAPATEAPPTPTAAASGAQDTLATPAAPAPVNPTEVVLTFSSSSWISVRDAAGSALVNGQMHKGDTRVLTGSPPYTLVIGNPGAIAVTVGGRPANLGRHIPGNAKRFKFDPRNPE
ncbi:RodZ family helix-turn-helix domain-containing protein [uncultured Thiodictyon sp.]|uniref:RodZ domain-containing protein n=1 Tax=uncultured Thiodictyon sp. TaxID=1846217 RepID=UPI0025F1EBE4|nr:RodZ family helix-turn-helix domain-containing protein [uncultured Thiodictyon sp.]